MLELIKTALCHSDLLLYSSTIQSWLHTLTHLSCPVQSPIYGQATLQGETKAPAPSLMCYCSGTHLWIARSHPVLDQILPTSFVRALLLCQSLPFTVHGDGKERV